MSTIASINNTTGVEMFLFTVEKIIHKWTRWRKFDSEKFPLFSPRGRTLLNISCSAQVSPADSNRYCFWGKNLISVGVPLFCFRLNGFTGLVETYLWCQIWQIALGILSNVKYQPTSYWHVQNPDWALPLLHSPPCHCVSRHSWLRCRKGNECYLNVLLLPSHLIEEATAWQNPARKFRVEVQIVLVSLQELCSSPAVLLCLRAGSAVSVSKRESDKRALPPNFSQGNVGWFDEVCKPSHTLLTGRSVPALCVSVRGPCYFCLSTQPKSMIHRESRESAAQTFIQQHSDSSRHLPVRPQAVVTVSVSDIWHQFKLNCSF